MQAVCHNKSVTVCYQSNEKTGLEQQDFSVDRNGVHGLDHTPYACHLNIISTKALTEKLQLQIWSVFVIRYLSTWTVGKKRFAF